MFQEAEPLLQMALVFPVVNTSVFLRLILHEELE